MIADFEPRLRAFAKVIVRVGLNLQPGQRLIIAEPYELQGVARSAEVIVESIIKAAATDSEVIWGDGPRLREFAEKADWRGFNQPRVSLGRRQPRFQFETKQHPI